MNRLFVIFFLLALVLEVFDPSTAFVRDSAAISVAKSESQVTSRSAFLSLPRTPVKCLQESCIVSAEGNGQSDRAPGMPLTSPVMYSVASHGVMPRIPFQPLSIGALARHGSFFISVDGRPIYHPPLA